MHDADRIRSDFDEIARHANNSGRDRYDQLLAALVPATAIDILDVGCGVGRLTLRLARNNRTLTGIDLSPEMIARARVNAAEADGVSFVCGDFLTHPLSPESFDCVVTAATLHHMDENVAVPRMTSLLRPGGRLIIHDLRTDDGILDQMRAVTALLHNIAVRLLRTGRVRMPRAERELWARHGAFETYPTFAEARRMAQRLLPGAIVHYHWLWRYTIVWDKPSSSA